MARSVYPYSICWDCENACCGCSWSRSLKPVQGWEAIPTKVKVYTGKSGAPDTYNNSYVVLKCPKFKRDAYNFGLLWSNKPNMKTKGGHTKP